MLVHLQEGLRPLWVSKDVCLGRGGRIEVEGRRERDGEKEKEKQNLCYDLLYV